MVKIYRYELRRLLFNKFFLCLLLITALYSNQIMTGEIILGIANTAPFSGWSYGVYLAKILPILSVSLLFIVTFLYSRKEKQAKILIDATPMPSETYRLIRTVAIASAYILITLVPIGLSIWFYYTYFHILSFSEMCLAIIYTLVPVSLFILGLGLLLGRFHSSLIYVLMAVVLLLEYLPISFDLYGSVFLISYPLTLDILDPPFLIPTDQLLQRGMLIVLGTLMALIASKVSLRNHK